MIHVTVSQTAAFLLIEWAGKGTSSEAVRCWEPGSPVTAYEMSIRPQYLPSDKCLWKPMRGPLRCGNPAHRQQRLTGGSVGMSFRPQYLPSDKCLRNRSQTIAVWGTRLTGNSREMPVWPQ